MQHITSFDVCLVHITTQNGHLTVFQSI